MHLVELTCLKIEAYQPNIAGEIRQLCFGIHRELSSKESGKGERDLHVRFVWSSSSDPSWSFSTRK